MAAGVVHRDKFGLMESVMRNFLFAAVLLFTIAIISPASAASWTGAVNAAIQSGKFDQIDVIAAKDPGAAGDIAAYVLQKAENSNNPQTAIKLFDAAAPLSGQIGPSGVDSEIGAVNAILKLANNPGQQKSDPKGTAQLFKDALNISSQPGVTAKDPHLHDTVLADANDFLHNNPDLQVDDISLAQGNDFLHNNPDTIKDKYLPPNGDHPAPPSGQ